MPIRGCATGNRQGRSQQLNLRFVNGCWRQWKVMQRKSRTHFSHTQGISSAQLKKPIYTCEAVLTESAYLLQSKSGFRGVSALLQLVEEGLLKTDFHAESEARRIYQLLEKYQDVPMDFTDACIVVMTEQKHYHDCAVLTVDTKDFSITGGTTAISFRL